MVPTTSPLPLPSDFLWGAATSAFQIEGSLDADGRGPSVWDSFTAVPGAIEGGGDASIACDSYRRWPEDVELLAGLGLTAYRFSLGWSRVMPQGSGRAEPRALDHYERIVDALLERGITPLVTLNHWDMPQALMADGGWAGRSTVDAFAEYAAAAGDRLADRVPWWFTQNEPWVVALLGYRLGLHAPGVRDLGASVAAGHHMMLGHGVAADLLHERGAVHVGAALNLLPCVPASDAAEDVAAAHASDGYVNRWFLDVLAGRGYPGDMRATYERALSRSLDDVVLPGDEQAIGGRSDVLGVNFYTRRVVAAAEPTADDPFPWRVLPGSDDVERTDEGREVVPDALRDLLVRIHQEYRVPTVISENGAVYLDSLTHDGRVHDVRRQAFLRAHVSAVADAAAAGADVRGYLYWSLLDNFEWALGYRPRFGLVHVDYPTGRRTVKDSGRLLGEVARTGRLPVAEPTSVRYG